MSDLTLLLAAVAEKLPVSDNGAGAPPRIPGHEADRLASLGPAARPGPGRGTEGRRRRTAVGARLRRRLLTRPAVAAPPS
ncbi:hypothetical protein [Peterkaempfera bronchialis]|uniref:hypothetical protein n=1 Tax=Peterkaempfera bronchialis TaxID=2126346 RepID=UPI0013B42C10|nr:hypothetical protein [Peterkaempfera bronchialis]